MSESRHDPDIFWVDPRARGVLPLDGFHVSRSLARRIRKGRFTVSFDRDFAGVIAGCADRTETWINPTIARLYGELHAGGRAHSVEIWGEDGCLVGGSYGVALGAAWFGESMFSYATDASKIALAHLVDRLRLSGFTLFDTQFLTAHLATLGAVEISRATYRRRLALAIAGRAEFDATTPPPAPDDLLARLRPAG